MNRPEPTDRLRGRGRLPVRAGEPLGLLLVEAGYLVSGRIKPVFDDAGLRPRQVHLLTLLAERTSMTQQQLIETLRVDPSVLVGLLNDLENDALIRRVRDPKDRRRHIVELSTSGAQRLDAVLARAAAAEADMLDHLGDEGKATLRRLLMSILDQQAEPISNC